MCFKKNKYPQNAKYQKSDFVSFRKRDELSFGWIYDAHLDKEGNVLYTIQIGGQCPALLYDFKEVDIIGIKK